MPKPNILHKLKHRIWHRRVQAVRHWWLQLQGMKMGENCHIGKIDINLANSVSLGHSVSIESGVVFQYAGPYRDGFAIEIGDDCFIGTHTHLNIQNGVRIGNHCMIAAGCRMVDNEHGFNDSEIPMHQQPTFSAPIVLEDNVWIGANAVILKGVHIGTGSIIGAGAVVNRPVPPMEIWAGVPARKIRDRIAATDP